MTRKLGKRAVFNRIAKIPADLWIRGRLSQQVKSGKVYRCDLGQLALETGLSPDQINDTDWIAIRDRITEKFDIAPDELRVIPEINDTAKSFQLNLDGLEAYLLKGIPSGWALRIADGTYSIEAVQKILKGTGPS